MLEDYKWSIGVRFGVNWPSWIFSVPYSSYGNIQGLYDQDYIYNGKKLINPLDSFESTLQLGGDIAMLEHLDLVYNKYSVDEHGIKLEDVNRTNRQNWGSA
jgi:hypothetical protein